MLEERDAYINGGGRPRVGKRGDGLAEPSILQARRQEGRGAGGGDGGGGRRTRTGTGGEETASARRRRGARGDERRERLGREGFT
jgi:hypothetical protein